MADEAPEAADAPGLAEPDRLAALARYAVLDTPPDPDFDAVAALAASLCDVPVGLVTFVDDTRQFFKARVGFGGEATAPLTVGFCPLVVRAGEMLVISDTLATPAHAGNAATAGGVRFYAGVPLTTRNGHAVGTLCVLDTEPRRQGLDERQRGALATLARQVVTLLELRRVAAERDAQAARLAAVFAQAAVGLSEIAPDGRFLVVNDQLCAMLGRSRETLLRLRVQDVMHPDDLPRNLALLARLMKSGEPFSLDLRYLQTDGAVAWANSSVSRLLDDERRPRGALAVSVDVTARRAEEARGAFLAGLSDRLRALDDPRAIMAETAEALGRHLGADCAGYAEADASGEHVAVEQDWARPGFPGVAGTHRMDDYGPALAARLRAGRTVRVADTAAEPATAGELSAAAYAGIQTRACLGVPLIVDGRLSAFLFVLSEQPRAWSDEDVVLVEAVAGRTRDAVARARAEAARRERDEQFRTLADNISQLAWMTEPDGWIFWYNRRWFDYTGTTPEQMQGWGWKAAHHPDHVGPVAERFRAAVAAGEPWEDTFPLRGKDGQYRWFLSRALPIRDAAGRIVRWFGTNTDVTERREAEARLEQRVAERTLELTQAVNALHAEAVERQKAEEQLRQSQKMEAVGQLTGGIAHDFNNMLQGIVGGLELMRRRIAQGRAAEAGQYIEAAAQTAERAARLTHRLLAFARRQALQPRIIEPDELVRGMAELIRRTTGPQVEIELRLRDGASLVLCDPSQLENALLNLAINARDAMPDGGRLTIGTEDLHVASAGSAGQDSVAAGDYVGIVVSDTGTGMPPDVLARAFEPFFTTKPIGQGTGLGLSQTYGFARQSGGFVRLDSAPGGGTTVRLYLPRHAARPLRAGVPGPAEAGHARAEAGRVPETAVGTVLVVEDEPGVRALVVEALRELGCRVLEAGHGPAGLDVLLRADERVDVLVTDVGLPGLNGRQLADAARERDRDLPVLLMTGYAGAALDAAPLAPGMEVVAKPFTMQALAARVAALLQGRTAAPAP